MIASCRHFILIFLLFLLCVMAQNAPIHLEEREASGPLRHKTQQFYCTSVLLKNLAKFMVQVSMLTIYTYIDIFVVQLQVQHSVALPSERGNGTYSQESVNLVLQQFNFTCTTFTNAMAIKHQLQYSLFNGGYYMKNNGVIVKINNEEMMKNFTLILEYLQMVGNFLQNIEVCSCI